jgi:serine/threonine protein kinase/tetratricopeptide (TPR) repeat protein
MDMERIGKYTVIRKIGEGAMGVVYEAHDPVIDRRVALKMISSSMDADTDLRERFRREAKSAGKLNHPNIITVYDYGEEGGKVYIAMELLEGRDLRDIIRQRTPLSLAQKLTLMEQICDGLSFAHSREVIHRDLKPSNIHVQPNGQVKIMDFGLAKFADSNMTRTGLVMGTPQYMSPEQIQGQKADSRSDVFSLGGIFYELLSGKKPFAAESMHAVMFKALHNDPEPLPSLVPGLPAPFVHFAEKALSKDPEKRFQNGGEMRQALRELRKILDQGGVAVETAPGEETMLSELTSERTELRSSFPSRSASIPGSLSGVGARSEATERSRSVRPAASTSRSLEPSLRAERAPVAAPPQPRSKLPLLGIGAVALVAAGVGGFFLLRQPSAPAGGPGAAPGTEQISALTQALVMSQVELARKTLEDKEHERALAQAEQVLKLDPTNSEAQRIVESAKAALGELEAAVGAARTAIGKGQFEQGTQALAKILAINPNHPAAAELSGELNGHFRAEAAKARRALESSRQEADSANARSVTAYAEASRSAKEGESLFGQGKFAVAAQKFMESRDGFERAKRAAQEQQEGQRRAARAELDKLAERWVLARNETRAEAGYQPSFQKALGLEAQARQLTEKGDVAGAGRAYQEAISYLAAAREEAIREKQAAAARATPPPPVTSVAPTPPPPAPTPAVTPPARPASGTNGAASVVNAEEQAIRQTLASYKRAIEAKNIALYKSVQPGLSREEERQLVASFKALDSHLVDFTNISISVQGNQATVSLDRLDTIVIQGKQQKPVQNRQTLLLVKEPDGWKISKSQ